MDPGIDIPLLSFSRSHTANLAIRLMIPISILWDKLSIYWWLVPDLLCWTFLQYVGVILVWVERNVILGTPR